MKVLLVFNKYYTDAGQNAVRTKLQECFAARGAQILETPVYGSIGIDASPPHADFAVFWDKDVALARFLERSGIAVHNCACAIEVCDDKRKTYDAVANANVPLIPSLFAPLRYDAPIEPDRAFLDTVESTFDYPIIVKENVGSLGRQVYLVQNRSELHARFVKLGAVPHLYQPLLGKKGVDVRVYTVGKRAIAALRRVNPDSFVSNAAQGGRVEQVPLTGQLAAYAQVLAQTLNLDYGAIDFLESPSGEYIFLEANSNAYFAAAEHAGIRIAEPLAEYLCNLHSKKT